MRVSIQDKFRQRIDEIMILLQDYKLHYDNCMCEHVKEEMDRLNARLDEFTQILNKYSKNDKKKSNRSVPPTSRS